MTTAAETTASPTPIRPGLAGWALWRRQIGGILRIEVRKAIFGRRSLPIYILSGLPLFVLSVVALFSQFDASFDMNLGEGRSIYSNVYQVLILRIVIFFGCAGIFVNLFRGEILDRSLHYYLLSPVRRPVLVAGKYLAGLLVTTGLFVATTIASYALFYVPYGLETAVDDLTSGPGMSHLLAYVGISLLACIGYGALFLMMGLLFRNPILPIAALFGWELIHFLLPAALKKLSVVHYLKGMLPLPFSEGPLAVLVEPPPVWVSIVGLTALSAVAVAMAMFFLRRMEIRYSDD